MITKSRMGGLVLILGVTLSLLCFFFFSYQKIIGFDDMKVKIIGIYCGQG